MVRRRDFLKGLAGSAGLVLMQSGSLASSSEKMRSRCATTTLKGREFHLTLDPTIVNITGTPRPATLVNGMLPGPTLVWQEGDEVTIHVTNRLPYRSSIHWHGMVLPYRMDGVPGISFEGIAPGETFTYRFKVNQSGTFWYHSHSGFQEQTGLHGALVILPKDKEPIDYDRQYVVSLSDWSDEKPESIYRKLKIMSDYYNFNQRTIGDLFQEIAHDGLTTTWKRRSMWNKMRMSDRDLSDVTAYTYTYLLNGLTDAQNWTGRYRPGERLRLRLINQSAMTIFDLRIPGLKMTVVASDGNWVEPVAVDELRIGVAETYDVIVEPEGGDYALFAQSMDRSGFVAGTLSDRPNARAQRPPMDAPQPLTMVDMGMGMKKMKGMTTTSHTPHPWPITPLPRDPKSISWTMHAKHPTYRLHDPGVGLRDNGRKVLTYGDLKNLFTTADDPQPDREIVMHLTGNMERYIWSIDGIEYDDAPPLQFHLGERLRVTFVNDTMMYHPMHLHGMWSDLETGDETRLVRKHTVLVPPGNKISYRVTVDAPGAWAYHCHFLYHMGGMFRRVEVV